MYSWLWRHLPGVLPVRVLLATALLAAAVLLLLFIVFPAIDPHLPWNNVNVSHTGDLSGGGAAGPG